MAITKATASSVAPATAGDLVYGSGTNDAAVLALGTAGQVLAVNSSATEPEWVTPAGGGDNYSLLNAGGTSLSGVNTVTISGISGKNKLLLIHGNVTTGTANTMMAFRLNADTGNNYDDRVIVDNTPRTTYDIGQTSASFQTNNNLMVLGSMANSVNANSNVHGYAVIEGCNSAGVKPIYIVSGGQSSTGAFNEQRIGGAIYDSSSTISSITFFTINASNFTGGTIFLYATS